MGARYGRRSIALIRERAKHGKSTRLAPWCDPPPILALSHGCVLLENVYYDLRREGFQGLALIQVANGSGPDVLSTCTT